MAGKKERWRLTEEQWTKIEPLLPQPEASRRGGRPFIDTRATFEGLFWVLRTGAPWPDLPKQYLTPSTCWRRLRQSEQETSGWTGGEPLWPSWTPKAS